jgi:hypothetical protein
MHKAGTSRQALDACTRYPTESSPTGVRTRLSTSFSDSLAPSWLRFRHVTLREPCSIRSDEEDSGARNT